MTLRWCNSCNTVNFDNSCGYCQAETRYLAADGRPVFPEEVLLLELLVEQRGELQNKNIWNTKGNRYYVDGKKLAFSVKTVIRNNSAETVSKEFFDLLNEGVDYSDFSEHMNRFIVANKARLDKLEFESIEFIKKVAEEYRARIPLVSFSGGKDSTVVSSLVRRALGRAQVLHVFGDTTLELPMTYEYVNRFQRNNRRTPFLKPKSEHSFLDLCDKIGPPSRVMRWCCTVFKTGPISSIINRFSGNKKILTFYGIRRSESQQRSRYKEISDSPKIAKQVVASPVIDWKDADIWLYILSMEEDFNFAYRVGFSRVGCWCCPSNSDWAFFLARVILPTEANRWRSFLCSFAARVGKLDAEEYVDAGKWKARHGGEGMGVNYGSIKFEPCAAEENARNYVLTRPISTSLYEYFKPFGEINFQLGRKQLGEIYVVDRKTQAPVLLLQGLEGKKHLKINVVQKSNPTLLFNRVECQIRKYQSCIGCIGCVSICDYNAISIIEGEYRVNPEKCTGCMKCIAYFDKGCLVAKATQVKGGG